MNYSDITDDLHLKVCEFLEDPCTRKQLTLPRGFLKTCIASIAYPIWMALPRTEADEFPPCADASTHLYKLGPNVRILIASNVVTNAGKIINKIKKMYERGRTFQVLFPEVIPPNFTKSKWSDMSACVNRSEDYTESTFEAAGVGGSAISRHYDIIIEDDLIYAKKDDLTGKELQPDQDDIDKAIGWHKLALSLFVPGPHTSLVNVGTRWAKYDLVDYIRKNELQYKVMDVGAMSTEGEPTWPAMYGKEKLDEIKAAQGPYMFATQYLNKPMAPEDMLFERSWLQMYGSLNEIPKEVRKFTTVDLAGWGKSKRSRTSRAVVLTCAWDTSNHMWVLHYDVGKYDPTEVIEIIAKHWTTFKPEAIGIEEVYYQKALSHFMRREMQQGNIPWMSLKALKPEGNESKDLRIRALQPLASNFALHCRTIHREFIDEFCEYTPNSDMVTKDILDAAAYQLQIARPGNPRAMQASVRGWDGEFKVSIDDILKEILQSAGDGKDRFGNSCPPEHPFDEDTIISEATNPFYQED